MTQNDFYRETVTILAMRAHNSDPEVLASALYFHMKQHPENVKLDKAWTVMMKNIKNLLSEHFMWDMKDIHRLFIELYNLTKYMEKSA